MSRKRIAICGFDSQGHADPAYALTRRLIKNGIEVDYVTSDRPSGDFINVDASRRALAQAGATLFPMQAPLYRNASAPEDYGATSFLDGLRVRYAEGAVRSLRSFLAYCEKRRPDAVIADKMTPAGVIGAEHYGIPSATLYPFYCGNHLVPGAMPLFDPPINEAARKEIAGQIDAMHSITSAAPASVAGLFADHRFCNIVLTSREYHPRGVDFGKAYHFVGPFITSSASESAPETHCEPNRIYLSLGSIFGARKGIAIIRSCISALEGTDYDVLIAAGRGGLDAFTRLPANVTVKDFVDQADALRRSAAFVTHGGMNSVQQAILAQVPMVVLPQGFDQFTSARRLEELGCGIDLASSTDLQDDLRRALDRLIPSRSTRSNLAKQHDFAIAAGGLNKAVDVALSLVDIPSRAQV